MGERGVLKNDNGTITSLISKDEAQESEIDELNEIQRMIDRIRKGDHNEWTFFESCQYEYISKLVKWAWKSE